MSDDSKSPKTISRRLRWVGIAGVILFVFSGAVFFLVGLLVNRIEIPQSQQRTPDYLASSTPAPEATSFPSFDKPLNVALRAKSDDTPTSGHTPYMQFLEAELRDRPGLEGARISLELARITAADPINNPIYEFMNGMMSNAGPSKPLWEHGQPVTGAAAAWLREHSDIVAKYLRLAEGAGPPIRSLKLVTQIEDPDQFPYPDFSIMFGPKILAAAGQRLFDSGDLAGADRYWRAALRLCMINGLEPAYGSYWVYPAPAACIKNALNQFPRETLLEYRSAFASLHKILFPADGHRAYWTWRIAARRKRLVAELNRSWRNSAFGWEYSSAGHYAEYHDSIAGLEIPRLDRLAFDAATAMRVKAQSTQIIRDFDAAYSEILRRLSSTWPEIMAKGLFQWNEPPCQVCRFFYGDFFGYDWRDVPYFTARGRYFDERRYLRYKYWHPELENKRGEAWLNLTRAAIECGLTTETQVERIVPKQIDRESPWRDPFTEQPLRVMDGTSNTLTIYSLGPDMQDQRAAVTYDPTNGVISPGDIW